MNNEEKILMILEQLQGDMVSVKSDVASTKGDIAQIKEQQEVHTRSITQLENSVMHELKLLNENLPDAVARSEKLDEVAGTVENHGQRIFALEQKAVNE